MSAVLAGVTMIVDVPDCAIPWRPSTRRRSSHWPRPNECDDLASFEVLRHLDLAGLGDDGLRDQLALSRYLLGSLLAHRGSRLAEAWLRERITIIGAEIRQRTSPGVHERQPERSPAPGGPRQPETPSNGWKPSRGRREL